MGVGVYAFAVAVFAAALGVALAAFVFAGFFARARFFMARNLQ
jgi:hypothetical protein